MLISSIQTLSGLILSVIIFLKSAGASGCAELF